MADASMKNFYRDPLIAMAVLACIFFLVIVVIFVIWCKSRRQVEVKTVTVQPKKRPPTTKIVATNKNGQSAVNGSKPSEKSIGVTDVEATISLDDDTPPVSEVPSITITTENEEQTAVEPSPESPPEAKTIEIEQKISTKVAGDDDDKETSPIVRENAESSEPEEVEAKGETNESFQPDD